jgi:DNA polymerase iota
MASYYGDLSGNSSSSSSSDSNSSDENESVEKELYKNLWSRQCVHLDIDCFYCQCEEIDRDLRKNPRPLAIGQKHIIVTCNYEARRYGVKKLQLRENAMTACPSLLIVEGSDLQRYKRYSRSVYEAFRRSIKDITNELEISISARKGTMDEMMADLSPAVDRVLKGNRATTENNKENVHTLFIFGESATPTKLVEDQTGQETVVSFQGRNFNNHCSTLPLSRRNVHESYGTEHDRQMCVQRLNVASKLVARVCQYIFNETGFYVTSGISVSPFLAKLASDLNKPKSINLLFPWRSSHILYKMPLRKMQLVGGRTMRALDNTLEAFSPSSSSQEEMSVKTVM